MTDKPPASPAPDAADPSPAPKGADPSPAPKGADPSPAPKGADPSPAPEGADPSMEDILASIRRILNEDDSPSLSADHSPASPPDDDILVLDSSMMIAAPEAEAEPAQGLPPPIADPAPVVAAPEAEPPAAPPDAEIETVRAVPADPMAPRALTPDLVAPEAAAAAASSVGNLMRTLAGRTAQVYSGGPTLEDMVRAELRPLLKEWLDANLPPMVERLVRVEIERVVARAVP